MTTRLAAGESFANRFEIEAVAGSGGMGTVYRARDVFSGGRVALKLLRSSGDSPDEDERFAREARFLAELRDPGIVAYVDHGKTPDGRRFLAMEWLDGVDLAQRLVGRRLPLGDVLALLRRVAASLGVAHRRGVVHRDIKPSNIFLPGRDIALAKLLDFGVARYTATAGAMTRTGALIGTPHYMAPEQARGARPITAAADIFSVGCVAYECLVGEPPFVAEHVAALLVCILHDEAVPIAQRRPDVPESVATLIDAMLRKDAGSRPQDGGALLTALEALGEIAEPSRPTTAPVAMPPSARSAFAESEQVLFTLVVTSPAWRDDGTLSVTEAMAEFSGGKALVATLRALGVRADLLANGSLVVTVPQTGSATDQVNRAAQVALLVRERCPSAQVVVATGRGAADGAGRVGEVANRAASLLERRLTEAPAVGPEAVDARRSGVVLDELSARLLSPRFVVVTSPDGAILIGEEQEIDAGRPLLGKPTPCVGRESELGTLEAQLGGCIDNAEARVVLITAPPGTGKSRLRHELIRRVERREDRVSVLVGRGDLVHAGAPYGILADAILRWCGLRGGEAPSEQRARLQATVARHLDAAEAERIVLFVGELSGVSFPDASNPMLPPARHNPKIMRDRTRRAFLDWLAAECAAAPVLIVLDDLQWGDALSVGLLDEALRELNAAALCVLALGRPEMHEAFPKLWQARKPQHLAVRPFSKKACERLVRQVLGADVDAAVMARIVEQSGGNALFLEELIRAAAQGNAGSRSDTVMAMLQARIGRFDAGPRRAVRAASIFGQTFWRGGVAAILGLPSDSGDVDTWLGALVDQEIIEAHATSRLAGEAAYGFRHAMVRDAAQDLLHVSDLATGHVLAGGFLERAGEPDAASIADHFLRGGDRARAGVFYAQAAEQAVDRCDLERALRHVDQGVACGVTGAALGTLRSIEVMSNAWLNRFAQILARPPSEVLPLLPVGSRAWCRTVYVYILAAASGPTEFARFLPELVGMLAGAEPDPDARATYLDGMSMTTIFLATAAPSAQVQYLLGRLEAVTALESANPAMRRWFLRAHYWAAQLREPRPWSILTGAEEGIRCAELAGDIRVRIPLIVYEKALNWFVMGDVEGAVRCLMQCEKEAEQANEPLMLEVARQTLGRVLCEQGDARSLDEASLRARAVIENPAGMPLFIGQGHETFARVRLAKGSPQEALEHARESWRQLEVTPLYGLGALATLLRSQLALGDARGAVQTAEQGLGVIAFYGGTGYSEVEMRVAASEAFHGAGDVERACAELRETLRQIQIRADDITDAAWKNSFLTRNADCTRAAALSRVWGIEDAHAVSAG